MSKFSDGERRNAGLDVFRRKFGESVDAPTFDELQMWAKQEGTDLAVMIDMQCELNRIGEQA